MARKTTVSKYLAGIGRKGGKASGKARMEKLSPEKRVAIAKTAAAARWAKPITQADLKQQSVFQVAEWTADRVAQMGAEKINSRLAGGATVKPRQFPRLSIVRGIRCVPVFCPTTPFEQALVAVNVRSALTGICEPRSDR